MGQIEARLGSRGIPYRASGGQVLVPADREMEVLADLTFGEGVASEVSL